MIYTRVNGDIVKLVTVQSISTRSAWSSQSDGGCHQLALCPTRVRPRGPQCRVPLPTAVCVTALLGLKHAEPAHTIHLSLKRPSLAWTWVILMLKSDLPLGIGRHAHVGKVGRLEEDLYTANPGTLSYCSRRRKVLQNEDRLVLSAVSYRATCNLCVLLWGPAFPPGMQRYTRRSGRTSKRPYKLHCLILTSYCCFVDKT